MMEKIDPKQNSINKMVEILNSGSAAETKEKFGAIKNGAPNTYRGSKQGLIDWASFYLPQSKIDILNKWKTSMTNGYLATRIVEELGLNEFVWVHIAKARKQNGDLMDIEVKYKVFWNNSERTYDWDEESPVPVRPL